MDKLLPCPFCGSEAETFEASEDSFSILCTGCGVETPYLPYLTEAIAAWNRRAGDDTNVATNADRIRSMNDEELAEYIFDLGNGPEYCDGHCAYQDDCNAEGLNYNTCIKGVTDWLRQPVKEEKQ